MEKSKSIKNLDLIFTIWTSSIIIIWLLFPSNGILLNLKNIFELYTILPPIIYLITKKILTKESVIFNNRFDLIIHTFFVCMFLPFLFNTYISFDDTISNILECTEFLLVYNVTKNICKNKKNIHVILNVVLSCTCFVVIWGIETETTGFINKILQIIHSNDRSEYTTYCFNYDYHNVLSIVMATSVLIAQYKLSISIINAKRCIYSTILLISQIGLILAFSRIGIIIFCIIEIIIVICYIKNNFSKKSLIIFLLDFVIAAIYTDIFVSNIKNRLSILIWVLLVVSIIISCVFTVIIFKSKKFNINLNKKKLIITLSILISVLFLFYIFSLNVSHPVIINENNKDEIRQRKYTLHGLKPEKTYIIDLEYELKNEIETDSGYGINIFGVKNNGDYEFIKNVYFDNYIEFKPAEIYFDKRYREIKFEIEIVGNVDNQLTINKIMVNGKEQIINYKFFPNSIDYFVNSFTLKNVSLNERINIYKDAVNYSIKDKFIPRGGKTWKNIFQNNRSYDYYTTESHSRILDVLLNWGAIGFALYIGMCVIYFLEFIKLDKKYILIAFIPIMILSHASFDWILSQRAPLVLVYVILGIISSIIEKRKKCFKLESIIDNLVLLGFSYIVVYFCYCFGYASKQYKEYLILNEGSYIYSYQFMPYKVDYRKDNINSLEVLYTKNQDKLLKELKYMLKYERNGELSSYLRRYIEFIDYNNVKIDKYLVKNAVKKLYVLDIYNLTAIQQYIEDLNCIKLYIKDFPNMQESTELIKIKIRSEYDNMIENLKEYDSFPMNLGIIGEVKEENFNEVKLLVEALKEYY